MNLDELQSDCCGAEVVGLDFYNDDCLVKCAECDHRCQAVPYGEETIGDIMENIKSLSDDILKGEPNGS